MCFMFLAMWSVEKVITDRLHFIHMAQSSRVALRCGVRPHQKKELLFTSRSEHEQNRGDYMKWSGAW